jgi:hypothetical protein
LNKFNGVILGFLFLVVVRDAVLPQSFSIQPQLIDNKVTLFSLSPSDSIMLASLPSLTQDDIVYKSSLPFSLDNSTQPYFRPLFDQVSLECGQYAGIAFNFTYEINCARNTSALLPENQFPTHYTFNFMNGGFGWSGVSYIHSFEIAKVNGHPNVIDYGGLNQGGPGMWLSGYDKYYNGMFNKIDQVYQIAVGTPEGLLTLKHWLHNHLKGAEVGGIACFYSPNPWNPTTLPADTPEGGKHVITGFSGSAGHSSTIAGYNDSIRYDYNQDGFYTNHIDINNDGVVDMRDWEIGGLLFTDSYNGGINYADSGFCYMMYKTLADNLADGGIWNNAVHVVTVKEDYSPQLTMKATINHTCRDRIKIMAGVSNDPSASTPEFTISFPFFDFQGGCQHMQGGYEPDAKSLEFGLDVTPLLGHITSGSPARFFLMVYEFDPNGWGSGFVESFELIDYISGGVTYTFPIPNIPVIDNGLTLLPVTATILFDQLEISTGGLPVALTSEYFSQQMEASGGNPPYTWDLVRHYSVSSEPAIISGINDQQLLFPDTIQSLALQVIDFEFPFYGKNYDSLYIHTGGFIMFDGQVYPWPYMFDEHLMIRKTRNISPFLNKYLYINTGIINGVWYEGDETYAAFRWNMSSTKLNLDHIEFAVILYPTGEIEFIYGTDDIFVDHNWAAGISEGDGVNYQFALVSNQMNFTGNQKNIFVPHHLPFEMELSASGTFSGTPMQNYDGIPIELMVTDHFNISTRKTFLFYSYVADANEHIFADFTNGLGVFPNPFSDEFYLEFHLTEKSNIEALFMDMNGKIISNLFNQTFSAGTHLVECSVEDSLSHGIYFLIIKTGNNMFYRKVVYHN